MVLLRAILFSALSLMGCSLFALPQTSNDRSVDAVLSNGMRVIVIPDPSSPLVAHGVFYNVGSFDDPLGNAGIAHFFEHLMFGPTINHNSGEYSRYVSSKGGRWNAFTSFDRTVYYVFLPMGELDKVMEFEADRMMGLLHNDKKAIDAERQVVLSELMMREDTLSRAMDAMALMLNCDYQFKRPIIGYVEDLNSIGMKDISSFYDRYYVPNNATLVVVGDVDPKAILDKANTYYGALKAGKDLPAYKSSNQQKNYNGIVPKCCDAKVVEISANAEQDDAVGLLLSASTEMLRANDSAKLSAALKILGYYLGAYGEDGKLSDALITNKKIASIVSVDVGGPYIAINVFPNKGVSLDLLTTELTRLMRAIYDNGLTDADLKKVRDFAKMQAALDSDGVTNKFMARVESLRGGASWRDVENLVNTSDVKALNALLRRVMFASNDMVYAKIRGKK